jgi:type IV pilus assembly protein PilN
MAKINLLPWREERRQELKKEFLVVLAGVAIVAFGLVFLAHGYVQGEIDKQQARNKHLQKYITELDQQVKEIKTIEKRKRDLLDRMKVIQELQGNRPVIVRVVDEIVRALPDGVFYQSLVRRSANVSAKGTAESNNRISSLMRKLDKSEWFTQPNLSAVSAAPNFGEQASQFQMTFKISSPSDNKDGEE